jgi:hypothetical protein
MTEPKAKRPKKEGQRWTRMTPEQTLPETVRFEKVEGEDHVEAHVLKLGAVFVKPAGGTKRHMTSDDVKASVVTQDDLSEAVLPNKKVVKYIHMVSTPTELEVEQILMTGAAVRNLKRTKGGAGVPDVPIARPTLGTSPAPPLQPKWMTATGAEGAARMNGLVASRAQKEEAVRAARTAMGPDWENFLGEEIAGLSDEGFLACWRRAATPDRRKLMLSDRMRKALPHARRAAVRDNDTPFRPFEYFGAWKALATASEDETTKELCSRAMSARGQDPDAKVTPQAFWRSTFAGIAEFVDDFLNQ